jgi:hypothetical protein
MVSALAIWKVARSQWTVTFGNQIRITPFTGAVVSAP